MTEEKTNQVLLSAKEDTLSCLAAGKEQTFDLQRGNDGTIANADEVSKGLREFLRSADMAAGGSAWCAIPARGISLRRLTLPGNGAINRDQLLRLQVEKEFPLSPDELAWGWSQVKKTESGSEILVAAVKQDLVRPLADLLRAAQLEPKFVPDILASGLVLGASGNWAAVVVAGDSVEWARFENRIPAGIRTFTRNGTDAQPIHRISQSSADIPTLHLRCDAAETEAFIDGLATAGFRGVVKATEDSDLAQLNKLVASGRIEELPHLQLHDTAAESIRPIAGLPLKWIALTAVLAMALVATRYLGPLMGTTRLQEELAAIEEQQDGLPAIAHELSFLQHIRENQPPYLAAMAVFSDAAPRGTKIEALSFDRRGEFSFRGQMSGSQQATDLRRKLIDSGMFSSVVLEEQSIIPKKKEVKVRFTARWNTDPKAKSEVLKRIDAKGEKKADDKKPGSPIKR